MTADCMGSAQNCLCLLKLLAKSLHFDPSNQPSILSMYGAAAPSGLWPHSNGASILLGPHVSSSLVFLESVMHPSGRRPFIFSY